MENVGWRTCLPPTVGLLVWKHLTWKHVRTLQVSQVDRVISLYDSIRTMEALLKFDNWEAPQRTPFHLSILRLTAGQKVVDIAVNSLNRFKYI